MDIKDNNESPNQVVTRLNNILEPLKSSKELDSYELLSVPIAKDSK
jgi:hypothetical protein